MGFPKFLRIAVREASGGIYLYKVLLPDQRVVNEEDATLVNLLAHSLGFSYDLVIPEDGQYGRILPDGNWTGMVGKIFNGQADMGIGKLAVTEARSKSVQFTTPYHITDATFVTDLPEQLPNSLAIYYPFSNQLWASLIVSIILFSVLFYFILRKKQSFLIVFIQTLGTFMDVPLGFKLQNPSQKILALFWVTGIMFLTSGYKAVFLSFLTFPPVKGVYTISQLRQAMMSEGYKGYTYKGSYIKTSMKESTDESLKYVGENLDESSLEAFWRHPLKHKAFIGSRSDFYFLQQTLLVSEENFLPLMVSIIVGKTFCCMEKLDMAISRLNAAGLFDKFLRDIHLRKELKESLISTKNADMERMLSLEDVSGAFFFLCIGYSFAGLTLIFELLIKSFKNTLN